MSCFVFLYHTAAKLVTRSKAFSLGLHLLIILLIISFASVSVKIIADVYLANAERIIFLSNMTPAGTVTQKFLQNRLIDSHLFRASSQNTEIHDNYILVDNNLVIGCLRVTIITKNPSEQGSRFETGTAPQL